MLDKLELKIRYQSESNVLINEDTCSAFEITKLLTPTRLTIKLKAKKPLSQIYTSLYCQYSYKDTTRVFANGYQSWSTSTEYAPFDKQYGLRGICKFGLGKKFAEPTGDYAFKNYSELEGDIHGFSYGYIRNAKEIILLGSLSEREGYTIINYKMHKNKLLLEKDLEGLTLDIGESITIFDIACFTGEYEEVFDKYFELLDLPKKQFPTLKGYTSWYNYFGKITEDILLRDLDGLSKTKDNSNIFQIDDGYQIYVGDWLTLKNDKFPHGMKYIADKIHEKGYLAGIWLAPTLAAHNSDIFKTHPDWFIRTSNNHFAYGASAWGGAYILDYENINVRDYIKHVFNTVLDDWGFDMVKLDFLYSECLIPRNNKTRGQIMCETMDFLRECVRDKLLLGCGVPLFPSFGKVDCCRIGCDVDLVFKDRFYVNMTNREIVNTKNAMTNTIFRRHLNGRAFANDPDVFILRDNVKFTKEQKYLLSKINSLLGSVLFVSDNVGEYTSEKLTTLIDAFNVDRKNIKILSAEYMDKKKHILKIEYSYFDEVKCFTFDIYTGKIITD